MGGGGGGGGGSLSDVGNTSSLEDVKKRNEFGFSSNSCDEKKDGIGEPFIGLKLGKRTYFENNYAKSNKGFSGFGVPVSSVDSKKVKLSVSRCQVDGCSLDLSGAKEYHRKHKVCETHSKSPKVIVAGMEKRFCQQCSRFQSMSEFDEEKRSCRKRLSNHNARRRKPQYEPTRVNSPDPFSSFYTATGSIDALTHSRGVQLSKGTRAEIFDQDAVDIRRALSLLSNSTWGLRELGPHPIYLTGPSTAHHELLTAHHGSQLNTQDYFQANQQPTEYAFQFHHNE